MQKIIEQLTDLLKSANSVLQASQNQQKKIAYMYLIFTLLTLSFFGIFAIKPTLSTISELKKQYEDSSRVLTALKEKNRVLQVLGAQYAQIEPQLSLITNAIPESPRISELTRQIEVISFKNNVSINKLDIGVIELYPAKKSNPPIFSYSFSVSVKGSESDINNFITQILNFERVVSIERISTGKSDKNNFDAAITGKAYFYKN